MQFYIPPLSPSFASTLFNWANLANMTAQENCPRSFTSLLAKINRSASCPSSPLLPHFSRRACNARRPSNPRPPCLGPVGKKRPTDNWPRLVYFSTSRLSAPSTQSFATDKKTSLDVYLRVIYIRAKGTIYLRSLSLPFETILSIHFLSFDKIGYNDVPHYLFFLIQSFKQSTIQIK